MTIKTLLRSIVALSAVGLIGVACRDRTITPPPNNVTGQSATLDQAPTAAPNFAWLAPLGTGTPNPSTFDANAAPQIQICAWTGSACSGTLVAQFSATPTAGNGPIVVNKTVGDYEASWNLLNAAFTTRKTYRIRVLQGTTEIGAVSVDVVRGRWALTRSDGALAPLASANELTTKFAVARLTKDALSFTAPATFRPMRQTGAPSQVIALYNFEGQLTEGGVTPVGGAEIVVSDASLPQSVSDLIVSEIQASDLTSTRSISVSGEPGTEVFATYDTAPGQLTNVVIVYVPHGQLLYRFYLSYQAEDPAGNQFLAAFQQMLDTARF